MEKMNEYRKKSAFYREEADRKERAGLLEEARQRWHLAANSNLSALKQAESYDRFDEFKGEAGEWKVRSGSTVSDKERLFVRTYCDTLGRQGGLYRRLGCLKSAQKYYQMGQRIEQIGDAWDFQSSYCTMSCISIQIETRQASASLQSNMTPGIQDEISRARKMVEFQIVKGTRGSDAWAKADFALVILLTSSTKIPDKIVKGLYQQYTSKAESNDIESTRRILKSIKISLKKMGDPVADQIKWGIDALQEAASNAKKRLRGDANADVT